jgi:hypothetical protein
MIGDFCGVMPLSLSERYQVPWVTLFLLSASVGFYYLGSGILGTWVDSGQTMPIWLVHPIIHNSIVHLVGNLVGLGILGTLVESWMVELPWKTRMWIMLFSVFLSYCISLLPSIFAARPPAVGLSAIVSALLPFTASYYAMGLNRRTSGGLNRFAPIGIGFMFALFVSPLIQGLQESGLLYVSMETELHLLAFAVSGFAAVGFFMGEMKRLIAVGVLLLVTLIFLVRIGSIVSWVGFLLLVIVSIVILLRKPSKKVVG